MFHLVSMFFALPFASPAFAQDFQFAEEETSLFQAQTGTLFNYGIGRPTVIYDTVRDEYVMMVEGRLTPNTHYDPSDYPNCSTVFGMMRATSGDGVDWTLDPEPVLVPRPGGYEACAAAHPNMIFDASTEIYHLYFKSEQPSNICDQGPVPAWGCAQFTGVGYAESDDGGVTWDISEMPAISNEQLNYDGHLSGLGYPTVLVGEDTWFMWVSRIENVTFTSSLSLATSTDGGDTWYVDPTPVLEPGFSDWAQHEITSPVAFCEAGGDEFSMFFAGNTRDNPSTEEANEEVWGLAYATSIDGYDWAFENEPYYRWNMAEVTYDGDANWPHMTFLKVGDDQFVVYHTERVTDETGTWAHMFVGSTTADWEPSDVDPRICRTRLPDTDSGDTDDFTDDTDVDDKKGCGCQAIPGALGWMWPLVPLLMVGRRRSHSRHATDVLEQR